MPKLGKRFKKDTEKVELGKLYPLSEAVTILKSFSDTKFDQSVEVCMHLGIDHRQADQAVRGSFSLPHGIGASKRVIAFCGEDKKQAALDAGAIEAGGEDLVKKVEGGFMDFDVAVASPDMMRFVGKLGRVLGPRGLMPSPKSGTVTPKVAQAVAEYAAGKVEFRNDKGGNIHAVVGKKSFDEQKLVENIQAFVDQINKLKPSTTKGVYVKKIAISATMTPGVQVEVE